MPAQRKQRQVDRQREEFEDQDQRGEDEPHEEAPKARDRVHDPESGRGHLWIDSGGSRPYVRQEYLAWITEHGQP